MLECRQAILDSSIKLLLRTIQSERVNRFVAHPFSLFEAAACNMTHIAEIEESWSVHFVQTFLGGVTLGWTQTFLEGLSSKAHDCTTV
jgi:hypothetical protein